MGQMKRNIDLYLGLAAWLVALLSPVLEFLVDVPGESELKDWVIPLVWACLVLAMLLLRRRQLRRLWWVWLSAPVALLFWLGGLLMFIAWSSGGFAP